MKPITKNYTAPADANSAEIITLSTENIQQQVHILANILSGAAEYQLQGNLGMLNPEYAQGAFPVQMGNMIADPTGWFDIESLATASQRLAMDKMSAYMPLLFLRVIITTITGTLRLTILQQSIR